MQPSFFRPFALWVCVCALGVGCAMWVMASWAPLRGQGVANTATATSTAIRRTLTPTPSRTLRPTATPLSRTATLTTTRIPTAARTPIPFIATPVTNTVYLPVTGYQGSVYLPVVKSGQELLPQVRSEPVFGLLGLLEAPLDHSAAQRLIFPNGRSYALIGDSDDVRSALEQNAASPPHTLVKVWGMLYQSTDGLSGAYIVVTDLRVVRRSEGAATLTATLTATTASAPSAIGKFDQVNLRSGPGAAYPRTGAILLGDVCLVSGRDRMGAWALIECPGGSAGWIETRFVTLVGALSAAPMVEPQATPTPLPTPTLPPAPPAPPPSPTSAFQAWRALYFANPQLAGVPTAVGDLALIDFNWGAGAPIPGLPVDSFSILFERTMTFAPGFYFFTVEADDGVRVFVDGQLIIDQWYGAAGQVYRVGRSMNGQSDLRVEYNEVGGAARVRVAIQQAPSPSRWDAVYFLTPGAAGETMLTQQEPDGGDYRLDYNWGAGGPFSAPADNWSARWVARYRFEAGNYIFYAQAEDGVRVAIDGHLVINRWSDGYQFSSNRFVGVGGEEHTITVEYFDRAGNASLRVWWIKESSGPSPQ